MDPWQSAVANFGADFEAIMAVNPVTATNAAVTVRQVDPDSGNPPITKTGVPALKMERQRQAVTVGEGEVGLDTCQFVFRIATAGFTPKARDQITDAAGITWSVTKADLIGFNQLAVCDVEIKR